jgi:hypothetical protein
MHRGVLGKDSLARPVTDSLTCLIGELKKNIDDVVLIPWKKNLFSRREEVIETEPVVR